MLNVIKIFGGRIESTEWYIRLDKMYKEKIS